MSEQREAIAHILDSSYRSNHAMYLDEHDDAADAVIAHLWREAMTWEVAEAGAKCLYRVEGGLLSDREFDALPDTRKRMLTEACAEVIFGSMTALLGLNPNEQENQS